MRSTRELKGRSARTERARSGSVVPVAVVVAEERFLLFLRCHRSDSCTPPSLPLSPAKTKTKKKLENGSFQTVLRLTPLACRRKRDSALIAPGSPSLDDVSLASLPLMGSNCLTSLPVVTHFLAKKRGKPQAVVGSMTRPPLFAEKVRC